LAFGCWLFALGDHVRGLVHPVALLAVFGQTSPAAFPEPERAVGDGEPRGTSEPAALQVEAAIAPVLRALASAIGEADQFLAASGVGRSAPECTAFRLRGVLRWMPSAQM